MPQIEKECLKKRTKYFVGKLMIVCRQAIAKLGKIVAAQLESLIA